MKKKDRIRGTTPEIEQAAGKLRKNLTPAEDLLWSALRNKQFKGLRFRCQHPVGNLILDFYCPSCKLVVEVDGKIHDRQIEYDDARTDKLAEYGYKVLRFSNEEVVNNLSFFWQKTLTSRDGMNASQPLSFYRIDAFVVKYLYETITRI